MGIPIVVGDRPPVLRLERAVGSLLLVVGTLVRFLRALVSA
jgi:hypothetical protein